MIAGVRSGSRESKGSNDGGMRKNKFDSKMFQPTMNVNIIPANREDFVTIHAQEQEITEDFPNSKKESIEKMLS